MTNPPTAKPAPNPERKRKQKQIFWIASWVFIGLALIYGIYWLAWGRYHVETDDAYVNGNMISITPQVDGIVTTILADNTQMVEEGQPLIILDVHDYEIALDHAKAALGDAVRSVVQMFLRVEELEARREMRKSDLLRSSWDYNHRQALVADGGVSREDFEHSETAFYSAFAALREVDKQLQSAQAEVENTSVDTHPSVEEAKANLRRAFLNLHRCIVRAPARGIVTQRKAQVGQWTRGADTLFYLVPLDQMWVDANYREVELKNLRIGQPVELIADMYGRDAKYSGKIVGLNPGSGSVFSILPPQNATGNWIKIIQRIPVKISLNQDEVKAHPLVLGLTMTVRTSTYDRSGQRMPDARGAEPVYQTDVYRDELAGVDELIAEIVAENRAGYGIN